VGTEQPTSGNVPITESTDTEAIEAQERQQTEEERIAEEHTYTGPQLTAEEYDKQGKGPDYDPEAEPVYGNPLGQAQPGPTGSESKTPKSGRADSDSPTRLAKDTEADTAEAKAKREDAEAKARAKSSRS
jgi:hypothetical protein